MTMLARRSRPVRAQRHEVNRGALRRQLTAQQQRVSANISEGRPNSVRAYNHNANEYQPEIELPHIGQVAQCKLKKRDTRTAPDDGAGEIAHSADLGHQDEPRRNLVAHLRRIHDLENWIAANRRQCPRQYNPDRPLKKA